MLQETNFETIERLRHEIDAVLTPLVADRSYALLDFPDYGNVGDSLIYLGELAWLQARLMQSPSYICSCDADRDHVRNHLQENATIYLQGGGNFGDIWAWHQDFREFVLEKYRGRPVLQMPQSIHYADEANADRMARVIERHGAFTLLVRDHESFEFATRKFACPVFLCPDMAFAMGRQARIGPVSADVLMLLRTDKEKGLSAQSLPSVPPGYLVADWLDDEPDLKLKAVRYARLRRILRLWRGEPKSIREAQYFHWLAENRAARGIKQLSAARFVITDRLHVHILCTLLGLPHAFLDNSYGKISRFSSAFGTLWNGAYKAETLEEALAIADAHLAKHAG